MRGSQHELWGWMQKQAYRTVESVAGQNLCQAHRTPGKTYWRRLENLLSSRPDVCVRNTSEFVCNKCFQQAIASGRRELEGEGKNTKAVSKYHDRQKAVRTECLDVFADRGLRPAVSAKVLRSTAAPRTTAWRML